MRSGDQGDRVYGRMPLQKIGAFAEYAAIDASAIAKVPKYLSDEEAACVPLTALTAKDAGKKCFGISLLEDPGMVADLLK